MTDPDAPLTPDGRPGPARLLSGAARAAASGAETGVWGLTGAPDSTAGAAQGDAAGAGRTTHIGQPPGGTPGGESGRGAAPDMTRALADAAQALQAAAAAAAAAEGKTGNDTGRTQPVPRPVPDASKRLAGDAGPDSDTQATTAALQSAPYPAGLQTLPAAEAGAVPLAPEAAASTPLVQGLQARPAAALDTAGARAALAGDSEPGAAEAAAATTAAAAISSNNGTTPSPAVAGLLASSKATSNPALDGTKSSTLTTPATAWVEGAGAGAARADKSARDGETRSPVNPVPNDPNARAAAANALGAAGPVKSDPALSDPAGARPARASAGARTAAVGNDQTTPAASPLAAQAAPAALSSTASSSSGGNGGGTGNPHNPRTEAPLATAGDGSASAAGLPLQGPVSFAGALAQAQAATMAPPAPTARVEAPVGSANFAAEAGYQLSVLVQGGLESAQLQLNPAEMGPVTVQIVLDGANAQVHLAASDADTRQALEASMPELASNLREAGLTLTGGGVSEQPNRQPGTPADAGSDRGRSSPGEGRPTAAGGAAGVERGSDAGAGTRPAGGGWQRRGMVDLVA